MPWSRWRGRISETGFDSLWLPEVLTRPGPDPLVGLAWVSGACPGLKIGTTMLLPGRNLVWLAKAVATLDVLSGGRFLLTFVPGLASAGSAAPSVSRRPSAGEQMDDALPVLRRLWAGEEVTHDGPAGSFAGVSVSPRPGPGPLRRLARREPARPRWSAAAVSADGWIPAFCTPADAAAGKAVIDRVAAAHGRTISPEHFGVSLAYAPEGTDVAVLASSPLARRARGRPLEEIIPVGSDWPADDAGAVPRGRVLEVHRAPDGAARGVAARAGAPGRRGGRPPDLTSARQGGRGGGSGPFPALVPIRCPHA